jgi:hypothetical protein
LGAVIGGAIAGAVLAVAVTVGWICWGRRIKRDRQKQQEELVREAFWRIRDVDLVADLTAVEQVPENKVEYDTECTNQWAQASFVWPYSQGFAG